MDFVMYTNQGFQRVKRIQERIQGSGLSIMYLLIQTTVRVRLQLFSRMHWLPTSHSHSLAYLAAAAQA